MSEKLRENLLGMSEKLRMSTICPEAGASSPGALTIMISANTIKAAINKAEAAEVNLGKNNPKA